VSSYDDIVKNHEVTYVAGGASQNAARGAAVGAAISPGDRDV
jgi:adenosine kinase